MKILDQLPYAAIRTRETVRGESVVVKPYQILVWVSVGLQPIAEWDPRMPRLPAVLDSGNNHTFSLSHQHLVRWAGIPSASLGRLGLIRESGQLVPLHAARLWLHANVRGERRAATVEPIALNVEDGIAVFPDETGPRLPVLDLRALTRSKLYLTVDAERLEVHLRTPDLHTKLLRWLG